MADELTEQGLIDKISAIDAEIATITATLGDSGSGAAQYVDYEIGNKSVSGSQRLEGLLKAREVYQSLLKLIPNSVTDHAVYDVEGGTGHDHSEQIGDE